MPMGLAPHPRRMQSLQTHGNCDAAHPRSRSGESLWGDRPCAVLDWSDLLNVLSKNKDVAHPSVLSAALYPKQGKQFNESEHPKAHSTSPKASRFVTTTSTAYGHAPLPKMQ
jgi:hypothetical protein